MTFPMYFAVIHPKPYLQIGVDVDTAIIEMCLEHKIPVLWDYDGLLRFVPYELLKNAHQQFQDISLRKSVKQPLNPPHVGIIKWDDL